MNANQSNYISQSVPNVAQPIYQNRQPQQSSIVSAYSESRYAPTLPQHVPTPSQPTVQTASNITQHPNGYQINPMMSQQDYSRLFQTLPGPHPPTTIASGAISSLASSTDASTTEGNWETDTKHATVHKTFSSTSARDQNY